MITSLHVEHLKGFDAYDIDFSRLNLLVGGNNSGKTTIFHALGIFFWCATQTADVNDADVTFRKTQLPELGAVPYFNTKDLFHNQRIRAGRQPQKIIVSLTSTVAPDLSFSIYPAFSRNLMIDGAEQTISRAQFDSLMQLNPVYVPGTIGITVREELYREVAQERMILEGRQNQVLRNLVYRLKKKPSEWQDFSDAVRPLFSLGELDVPFNESIDEWLTATYEESECRFDFVSAGSGFLQVINLLSFLFLHTSRVALLDEPDSHMHDDLQRLTFDLLDRLSQQRKIQIIVATHSPTLIDAAGLEHVILIDRTQPKPLRAQDVETLVPLLADRGVALPPTKVMNTLKARTALFVEGKEADFQDFILRVGEVYRPGFKTVVRGLTVFETGGATKRWPFDSIEYFQQLLQVTLNYVHVSDRDFFTDDELTERGRRAHEANKRLVQFSRRHRESYLVVPSVLAKVLSSKWSARHQGEEMPIEFSEQAITDYVLDQARLLEDQTRSTLTAEHEPQLRGTSDHRSEGLQALNSYFRKAYTEPLARNEIPYKLLDCKQVLRDFRTKMSHDHRISFSDKDILDFFQADDIPTDLREVLDAILALFPATAEDKERRANAAPLFENSTP